MASIYDFNLLISCLANLIGTHGSQDASTMLTCHVFAGLPTMLPKMKVVASVYFAGFVLADPFGNFFGELSAGPRAHI